MTDNTPEPIHAERRVSSEDWIGAAGLFCLLYGLSLWSKPLALVVAGLLLLIAAVVILALKHQLRHQSDTAAKGQN